jgi:small membrane protein
MIIFLPIQIILILFLLFAVSRVFLRLKDGSIAFGAFLFWMGLWILAGFAVLQPSFTSFIAAKIGIQRGTDVVIYISLVLLFYLVFRTNIIIENLREEITKLTKEIALKHQTKDKNKEQ